MKIDIERKKFIAIFLIALLTGLGVGIVIGYGEAVKDFTEVAQNFIDIDVEAMKAALTQYKVGIKNCYNG